MHSASERHSPKENHLLGALPAVDYGRICPQMELVKLPLGEILYESGARLQHCYFPISGVVSLLHTMENGATAEVAVIGNDGCVGIAILLGGGTTPSRAVVQIAGSAYRVASATILNEFQRAGPLQRLLLRYIQALMTQMSQTAVCNRHHTVEQQLCRWLLLSLDRVPSNRVDMTQELISKMLGVRRPGITRAASKLQEAGLMVVQRGYITVADRMKLEAHACECYAIVKAETDRLLAYKLS